MAARSKASAIDSAYMNSLVELAAIHEGNRQASDAVPPLEFAKSPTRAEPPVAALAQAPEDDSVRVFYGRLLRDQREFDQAAAQFTAAFDRVRALAAETPRRSFLARHDSGSLASAQGCAPQLYSISCRRKRKVPGSGAPGPDEGTGP